MSTPTPPQSVLEGHTGKRVRWSFRAESWDGWLVSPAPGTSGMLATIKRDDGEDWVVMARNVEPIDPPAASAPQGDTADVIERAARRIADTEARHFGHELGEVDWEAGKVMWRNAAREAAGLLAASPAAPQALTADRLADALQNAWNEWCNDAHSIPDGFGIHGPSTTRVTADFAAGHAFVGRVLVWLAESAPTPADDEAAQEGS